MGYYCVCDSLQVLKREIEEKRPLVEANLDTGRSYMREDSLEEKRVSMDSGEGRTPLALIIEVILMSHASITEVNATNALY